VRFTESQSAVVPCCCLGANSYEVEKLANKILSFQATARYGISVSVAPDRRSNSTEQTILKHREFD